MKIKNILRCNKSDGLFPYRIILIAALALIAFACADAGRRRDYLQGTQGAPARAQAQSEAEKELDDYPRQGFVWRGISTLR